MNMINVKTRPKMDSSILQATRVNSGDSGTLKTFNSSRMSTASESISKTGSIKKGVLWMQSGRIFSRWKQRYFVLTRDYLQCFKRSTGSNRISEMGKYLFKITLADIRKLECKEHRSINTIEIVLNKDDRVLLKCEKNLNDWFAQLKIYRRLSNERRDSLMNPLNSLKRTASFMSSNSSSVPSVDNSSVCNAENYFNYPSPSPSPTISQHFKFEYPFISTLSKMPLIPTDNHKYSEKLLKIPRLRLNSKCDRLRPLNPLIESNKFARNSGINRSSITPYTRNPHDRLIQSKPYSSFRTDTSSIPESTITTSDYSPYDNFKSHRRNYKRKTLDKATRTTAITQHNSHDFSENVCYRTDKPLLF